MGAMGRFGLSCLSSWMLKARSMGPSGSSCLLRPTFFVFMACDFRPTFFAFMACIAFLDMVFNAVFAFLAFIALVDMVFIAVFAFIVLVDMVFVAVFAWMAFIAFVAMVFVALFIAFIAMASAEVSQYSMALPDRETPPSTIWRRGFATPMVKPHLEPK